MLLRLRGRPSHLRRDELIFLSKLSTAVMGNSYIRYIQALNIPGGPDLSTAESHVLRLSLGAWRAAASFRSLVKSLPRLFTDFSDTDGIVVSPRLKRKRSVIFPFLKTKHHFKMSLFVLSLCYYKQSVSEISFTIVHEQNFNLKMRKWPKALLPNNTVLSQYQ